MRNLLTVLAILLALMSLPGCNKTSDLSSSDEQYKEAYERSHKKLKAALEEKLEQRNLNYASHLLLNHILRLINRLDAAAEKLTSHIKEYRTNLPTARKEALAEAKAQVASDLAVVLGIISEVEAKLSKDVLKKLNKDADADVIVDKDQWKKDYKDAAAMAEHMQGTRDTYLLLVEDFNRMVQIRLVELGITDLTPTTPTRITHPNPIVRDLNSGGRVTGYARDSQTGNAISGANVGFKHEQGSSPYFYETNTDSEGKYRSPYLLPNKYYVDIKKEGRAISRDSVIEVTRGQDRQSNFTLTEAIPDGQFRIVVSWCNELVAGAVKDVDSYLTIPDVGTPLHFPYNFKAKRAMYHNTTLDLDDTTWEGPETTTIHVVENGTYKFYVNNYDTRVKSDALGKSEIRVEVYQGDHKVKDYRVPQGRGLNYEVFHIVDGQIQDVKQFNDALWMAGNRY